MRTTLDIDDDVLQAAKELAQRKGGTAGQMISTLARRGLAASAAKHNEATRTRSGVPLLAPRGDVVTLKHVQNLMDQQDV
jgi:hypothetical protein